MKIKMVRSYKGSYGLLNKGEEVDAARIGEGEARYLIVQGHAVEVGAAKVEGDKPDDNAGVDGKAGKPKKSK